MLYQVFLDAFLFSHSHSMVVQEWVCVCVRVKKRQDYI